MRIHLADASKERGQYHALEQEQYTNTLFSYAYQGTQYYLAFLQHWEKMYQLNQSMRIHLAGIPSQQQHIHAAVDWESLLNEFA